MSYSLRDDEVSLALDCIVKDVDKNYDECLVEQFLEFIDHESRSAKSFSHDTESIVKRLKSYLDHESFQSLNQSRIFKIIYALIKGRKVDTEVFQDLLPILDRLFAEIYFLMEIQNLAAFTVLFNILDLLLSEPKGFQWTTNEKFNPPIQTELGKIFNLFQLAAFYICHCNNYHTRNSAEHFLITLVTSEKVYQMEKHELELPVIKETIEKLVFDSDSDRLSLYLRMLKQISGSSKLLPAFKREFSPSRFGDLSFLDSHVQTRAAKDFSRCLAYYEDELPRESVIHGLISRNMFDQVIIYLSQASIKDAAFDHRLVAYVLSPLMNSNRSTGTDETTVEPNDVPKEFNGLSPLPGLVHLSIALDQCEVSIEDKILIMDVLPTYIQRLYGSSGSYKVIMECCTILDKLAKDGDDEIYDLVGTRALTTLQEMYSASGAVKFDSGDTKKPITFALLKLLRNRTSDKSQISELASRFADEDVVEELTELLTKSQSLYEPANDSRTMPEIDVSASINPAMHCSVDDILNYELMSDGIQDCY